MHTIKQVKDGVCAPQGFRASGIHCGIAKDKNKKDLALIFTPHECSAAAVYTQNKVKGAPLAVTREHLADGTAQAIICNSGNANTCNADGEAAAREMCAIVSDELRIKEKDVIVASTGVIGKPLDVQPIRAGIHDLARSLTGKGGGAAAQAIMTTDTIEKEIAAEFELNGRSCKIGGIAKGSGMIHPDMATMLAFLTTDTAISAGMLQKAISSAVQDTFNMVSVDGDTSTNDMAVIMANGLAGNHQIKEDGGEYRIFAAALKYVCAYLARMMAKDGEGATKLLECTVTGAPDKKTAKTLAKSVICSSLVKTAMFGADANWGRVLCALGYAKADFDISKTKLSLRSGSGEILVCENGAGVHFNEAKAKEILLRDEIEIVIDIHQGKASAVAWGCDLSYEYVKINGDYRT